MPRFFPSLHRSKDRNRDEYARYDNYTQYNTMEAQPSAWRRATPGRQDDGSEVTPKLLSQICPDCDTQWQEEFVEYPESYTGTSGHHRRMPSRPVERDYAGHLPPSRSYDMQSESTTTAAEEQYDPRYYSRDNAIPIVQRESSLTRLQEVFSDHDLRSTSGPRPVTEVSLPQSGNTPLHSPVDVQPPPPPPPMTPINPVMQQPPPAEIRNVYSQQTPILVQSSTVDSQEADIRIQRSRSSRSTRDGRRSASRHPNSGRGTPAHMRRVSSFIEDCSLPTFNYLLSLGSQPQWQVPGH